MILPVVKQLKLKHPSPYEFKQEEINNIPFTDL